jgi:hypothetical protein
MKDSAKIWVFFAVFFGIVVGVKMLWWWGGQPSPRPKDMPADSVWIPAPTLPFSWHRGSWFGCWIDSDGHSNRCRLWNAGKENPLIFEGQYVSCQNHSPVPANELRLTVPANPVGLWVVFKSENQLVPAAALQNGEYLVPVDSERGCEQLQQSLARRR